MSRRTSLSVDEVRAQLVHAELQLHPVDRVEDIAGLPKLAGWQPFILERAIADLAHDGLLAEGPHGRLVVHPGPAQ